MGVSLLFWGSILMVACCAFYLTWWIVAFNPARTRNRRSPGVVALLVGAILTGLAWAVCSISGINALPQEEMPLPLWTIILGGIAGYVILLFVTRAAFKRPVTSELLLFVAWTMMELAVVDALFAGGTIDSMTTMTLFAVIGMALIICLVCYVLYYRLPDKAGYIDGMVPLATIGIIEIVMAAVLFV